MRSRGREDGVKLCLFFHRVFRSSAHSQFLPCGRPHEIVHGSIGIIHVVIPAQRWIMEYMLRLYPQVLSKLHQL